MMSATASACARSNLPLRNARLVNSPGVASRAPFFSKALMISFTITGEPWQEISTAFSFVKEFGSLKTETKTSSISFPASWSVPKCRVCDACWVKSFPLKTFCAMARASFPDKRMTAMALMPCAVANATMGSSTKFTGGKLQIENLNLTYDEHWNMHPVTDNVHGSTKDKVLGPMVSVCTHHQ